MTPVIRAASHGVVELGAVVDGGDEGHALVVDRVAKEDAGVEIVGGAGAVEGLDGLDVAADGTVVCHDQLAVLTAKLSPAAQFNDFALATVATAGELYGAGGQVQTTIADAWSAVGLPVPPRASKRTAVKPPRPANRPARPVRRLRGQWRERKAA